MSVPIVLLGPQRFNPSLGDAVQQLGIEGRIATVTAGWQERESDDKDLDQHLNGRTVNLRLHQRADEVWRDDPELRDAHRDRQNLLRLKQDFYRVRLEHELEAAFVIQKRAAPAEILEEEQHASIQAIRDLDAYHLTQCGHVRDEFESEWQPREREAVAKHRAEIAATLRDVGAIAIAGGNVATLLNRLDLFGIIDLARGLPLFAWAGGAMVISDRIVLFHDDPPQGPGAAEVLDRGLGLCPHVVPLPHPDQRLRLHDHERLSIFSRRFAPSLALLMRGRTRITWNGQSFVDALGIERLRSDGTTERASGWNLDGSRLGDAGEWNEDLARPSDFPPPNDSADDTDLGERLSSPDGFSSSEGASG